MTPIIRHALKKSALKFQTSANHSYWEIFDKKLVRQTTDTQTDTHTRVKQHPHPPEQGVIIATKTINISTNYVR